MTEHSPGSFQGGFVPRPGYYTTREPRAVTVDGKLTPYGEQVAEERHLNTWATLDEWPADLDPEPHPGGSLI